MRKDLAAGAANPEHARYRGAADVGVEHPDARATLKRRELINGTACALPCPPSPQVQKSAATSALPGGTKSSHLDRDRRTAQFDPSRSFRFAFGTALPAPERSSTVAPRIDRVAGGELPFTTCIVRKRITYISSRAMFASRSANACFHQRS
jgi:hypothetical protein